MDPDFFCNLFDPSIIQTSTVANTTEDADTSIIALASASTSNTTYGYGTASPQGSIVLTSPGTIEVACFSSQSGSNSATATTYAYGTLTATAVGAIHSNTGSGVGFHSSGRARKH